MRASGSATPTILFFQQAHASACRCGMPSVEEPCLICEQLICQDCAIFIDPLTRHPVRPSQLMARHVHRDFLAHRGCLNTSDTRLFPCVYTQDVPLMVRILKGNRKYGRSLRA